MWQWIQTIDPIAHSSGVSIRRLVTTSGVQNQMDSIEYSFASKWLP
jgi:hypothetical protein